jgi:hypothetical protein
MYIINTHYKPVSIRSCAIIDYQLSKKSKIILMIFDLIRNEYAYLKVTFFKQSGDILDAPLF